MSNTHRGRVGLLWRDDGTEHGPKSPQVRLQPVFDALASAGVDAQAVLFDDDTAGQARAQLLDLDGVLVWVDPIMGDRDRTVLDALLRDVAARGMWVSAHPDTIMAMGTKEVLYRTRDLGWGSDTHLYPTLDAFEREFAQRLTAGTPRVLKQHRGNGGIGVWKVELARGSHAGDANVEVLVQHAAPRTTSIERIPLRQFIDQCAGYFDAGPMVDQPFQPRIVDGMIRCYMVGREVAGFAHQSPETADGDVLGLPSAKTMFSPGEQQFARLKTLMETDWVPGMMRLLDLDDQALPLLWDADFLYGPKALDGADTYVLCEINCSSVLPFPPQVPARLAGAVAERLVASAAASGRRREK